MGLHLTKRSAHVRRIEFDHKAGIVQLVATSAHGLEMANNAIDALELPGAEDVDST
eukprot:m.1051374 g.1051374  ORF g.1051374 m.1051374 type:complete len:56 (-) comp24178_c0_seq6:1542-1709(-)